MRLTSHRVLSFVFAASVWISIGLSAYRVVAQVVNADGIQSAYPGGYGFRVFVAPFMLLGFQLFFWFRYYRRARPPARILAGLIGGHILLMIVLINALVAEVYDRSLPETMLWLYACTGIGHLAFALFGRENRYRA